MTGARARLVVRGLSKAFGGVPALAGVDLEVAPGEIHALLGQNGAGKSTLMNVLAGDVRADAGTVELDGAPFTPGSPLDARARGVVMVHQELSLCPHMSVAENVMLAALPMRHGLLDRAAMRDRARAALAKLGASIDVETAVFELPPALQQLVEIARALTFERADACKVLILDEPTSSLAHADVERLFTVLRGLRASGIAVVYVSHFLEEVRAIADGFTVLRNGATVAAGRVADVTTSDSVEQMAGRRVDELFPRTTRKPGEVVLSLDEIAGVRAPSSATLELRRGEVLGVAGLVGAGRTELLRAVFGLDPVARGSVKVLSFAPSASSSPAERLAQGVGMVSEDRKREGLCMNMSIADNLTLSRLTGMGPGPFIWSRRQAAKARAWMDKLGVRARGPEQAISELSGGNQQKVAIARLLHHDVDVLLLDEPTRGIDVEAKAQIYALIDDLAQRGKAILMVSSYFPELIGVCDRIDVMRRGVLGPSRAASGATEASLLEEASSA